MVIVKRKGAADLRLNMSRPRVNALASTKGRRRSPSSVEVLSYRLTIAELLGIAVILGTPYLLVGVTWSCTHTEHLRQMQGADLVVSFLGSDRVLASPAVFQCLHGTVRPAHGLPALPTQLVAWARETRARSPLAAKLALACVVGSPRCCGQ